MRAPEPIIEKLSEIINEWKAEQSLFDKKHATLLLEEINQQQASIKAINIK